MGAGPSRDCRQGAAGASPDDSGRPGVGEGGGIQGARIPLSRSQTPSQSCRRAPQTLAARATRHGIGAQREPVEGGSGAAGAAVHALVLEAARRREPRGGEARLGGRWPLRTRTARNRNRGPIGPGKYGYGKAPYILPLQTDTTHTTPQRLRRQRPSPRHSRSQGTSAPRHGYSPPAYQLPHHAPLYQSDSGPRSGLQTSEDSIYQLPLTHDQGFPAASSLFHSPETSNNHGMGAQGASQSFSQPLRSTAISCIGAYRQYKLCNTDVSTHPWCWAWNPLLLFPSSQLALGTWRTAKA
ncbi:Thrombospondin type-1 domain-containing protein 4 [Sciurus carolinensis]|uniref:Thrombospondin type-1 domain-containing protein 4 n=1 Tax=Sciurus carolinensis TaxID=30640 RepID=A0AA41N4R7_SCICA|nr:Thrombospondin type-1 domain-containing protein 4 [Sciurus carolinensis]